MRKQREVRENELDEAWWHKYGIWHLFCLMIRPNELESLLCNIDWGKGVAARQTYSRNPGETRNGRGGVYTKLQSLVELLFDPHLFLGPESRAASPSFDADGGPNTLKIPRNYRKAFFEELILFILPRQTKSSFQVEDMSVGRGSSSNEMGHSSGSIWPAISPSRPLSP